MIALADRPTLRGGRGNDIYRISRTSGQVNIIEDVGNTTENRLVLTDVTYQEIEVSQNGAHLLLSVDGAALVRLQDWFAETNPTQASFSAFEFADGATITDLNSFITQKLAGTATGLILSGTTDGDLLTGSTEVDTINALAGNDTILGSDGNETLNAGDGNDAVFGGTGDDTVNLGAGNDLFVDALIEGDATEDDGDTTPLNTGRDIVHGGDGNDLFVTYSGNANRFGSDLGDRLYGEAGDDYFVLSLDNETIDGGDGVDTIDLSQVALPDNFAGDTSSVRINLFLQDEQSTGAEFGGGERGDVFIPLEIEGESVAPIIQSDPEPPQTTITVFSDHFSTSSLRARLVDGTFEHVIGSDFNDTILSFTEVNHRFAGGDGNDTLRGNSGNDTLDGQGGNDQLEGGSGNDTLIALEGTDTVVGGLGNDTYQISRHSRSTVIRDFSLIENTDENVLVLMDVDAHELSFRQVAAGSDIDLELWVDGERIAIIDGFIAPAEFQTRLTTLQFADGSSVTETLNQFIQDRIISAPQPTSTNNPGTIDSIVGSEATDVLQSDAGNN